MAAQHGSRYPTSGSSPELLKALLAQHPRPTFSGDLSFLNNYTYRLGSDLLTPIGRSQLYDSGVSAAMSYGSLVERDLASTGAAVLVRAGSQRRIVDSALSFVQGFFGTYEWRNRTELQVQIEAPGFNSTLASNFACPNYGKAWTTPGVSAQRGWIKEYLADAKTRLAPLMTGKSSVPLDEVLLHAMQQVCSYDTVAFGQSDFCGLFSEREWLGFEYAFDLLFYGIDAAGGPLGRAMGVGWLSEMLARLTRTPWNANLQTSENRTLDATKETFPIDRRFYADFTHDSVITAVLSALDLPMLNAPLRNDPNRSFKLTQLVPYAARLVVEAVTCRGKQRYVRFILNDAVLPLTGLAGCKPRSDGMCELDAFVKSQEDRVERAQWSNCTRSDV